MNPAIDHGELAVKYPFLSREYLEDILRDEMQDSTISIGKFSVCRALAKGENFASDILRISVDHVNDQRSERTHNYIMKVALATEGMSDMLEEYDVFHREVVFYRDILPRIDERTKKIGYLRQLAPICYKVSASNPKHFIFEDLTRSGFRSADRRVGLSYTQLELVLEKVSVLHAVTAQLYDENPDLFQHHHYRNISEDVHHFYDLFRNSIVNCAEVAATWPTTAGSIATKLFKLEHTVISKGCQVFTVDQSAFNVLNHGDLWVNNVLFNHSDHPTEAALVDFAIGYFGSPAIDLSFLLFTSSANDVSAEQFDLLVQYYHGHLVDNLKRLRYPKRVPTLLELHEDILRKGFIGVMYSTFLIPLRLIEDTASADLGNLLGSNEEAVRFRRELFQHPKYQARMESLLNYYDRKGYLD